MPSFTFVSTANAFVLRGAVPVFIDIRPDTLNIDETKIEGLISPRTKAIVAVHYAGISCDMAAIMKIAARHNLLVIEDAAQAILSTTQNKCLGSIGHLGALSFHETKTLLSGEGGALLINDPKLVERAEIIREKGTNRSKFFRGQVDKYTWLDIGSSYLPSELVAAFLWAQLEEARPIIKKRLNIWNKYHKAFEAAEKNGFVRRPVVPSGDTHNGHLYYLLLPNLALRTALIEELKKKGVMATFHYIPLHTSPAGQKFGRTAGSLSETLHASDCLVRLPLWIGMEKYQEMIIKTCLNFLKRNVSGQNPILDGNHKVKTKTRQPQASS